MMRLLLRHMADRSARRGMAEHVDLALVDAHGAIFACMIDADRAADPRGGIRIARQPGRAGGLLSVLPRCVVFHPSAPPPISFAAPRPRSAGRRVRKVGVRTCYYRGGPHH